jgi:hypothetical protein
MRTDHHDETYKMLKESFTQMENSFNDESQKMNEFVNAITSSLKISNNETKISHANDQEDGTQTGTNNFDQVTVETIYGVAVGYSYVPSELIPAPYSIADVQGLSEFLSTIELNDADIAESVGIANYNSYNISKSDIQIGIDTKTTTNEVLVLKIVWNFSISKDAADNLY